MSSKIAFHWYADAGLARQLPYRKKGLFSSSLVCEWAKAKYAPPFVPELTVLSYEEQERRVLDMTAEWARSYSPRLIASLDLEQYTRGYEPYNDWIKLVNNIRYFQSQAGS